ncbi:hypothetical protein AX15_004784 [Amanita polypyramis BW_CC]|nr:hypothetical protein AX15_004784 [Amanita polypyramis BW_CC]
MLVGGLAILASLLQLAHATQIPLVDPLWPSERTLISPKTDAFVNSLLASWNSSGLAIAVVRRDDTVPGGWRREFASYGVATADDTPVTPDTLFAIASNSKLFLSLSVGLLISNETLARQRGQELHWNTKVKDLFPEWRIMDQDIDRKTNIQDMLSHRTGMPRHDYSGAARAGGIPEMIVTLRSLRPSAEFREKYQYNNLMYETLSYLPHVLLGQSLESYVAQHLFGPLNMSASTYSVAKAEAAGNLAHGFQWSMRDLTKGYNGTLVATIPYFQRPGEEKIWAGAGGILTSARDLSVWMSMLLNNGRHPNTNETVVPEGVLEHVSRGFMVTEGKASYPELSPKVYGSGQKRYSYRGHEIIEHPGHNPGFQSLVSRYPNDNLAIAFLSNDDNANWLIEAVKWRITDEILGLNEIDWDSRYRSAINRIYHDMRDVVKDPVNARSPSAEFVDLEKAYSHLAYGTLRPCYVNKTHDISSYCSRVLNSSAVKRILEFSDLTIPTFIIPFKRFFATHLRLTHFDKDTFNVSVIWSNKEVREAEGYKDGEDVIVGLDGHYEVEWVNAGKEGEGLAFRGGFWIKEESDLESREPEGMGEESAEVWFGFSDVESNE